MNVRIRPSASLRLLFLISVYLCSSVASAAVLLACAQRPVRTPDEETFRKLRQDMVREQLATRRWSDAPAVRDPRVLEVMREVPRHKFVPPELAAHAYRDGPLPIGHRQTISQPYIVAIMTEVVEPKKEHRALEIGTGSGYQAAVLSKLVAEVYTIEIVEPLGREAAERLRALGYSNVEVRIGNGYAGWPERAPFDAIIVTAGGTEIPPKLVEQLKPGGKMVIPVGRSGEEQVLTLITKETSPPYRVKTRELMPVRFVPLINPPPAPKQD